MHHRRTMLTSLIATTMFAASTIAGLAQSDSTDIDIVISPDETPDVLSVSIQEGVTSPDGTGGTKEFANVTFSAGDQVIAGGFTVEISDGRDPAPGWKFNISGADFDNVPSIGGGTNPDPFHTFSIENLNLFGVMAESTNGLPNDGLGFLVSSPLTTLPQLLISAAPGAGSGGWVVRVHAELTIPGDTPPGTYDTTITVEAIAAPGS